MLAADFCQHWQCLKSAALTTHQKSWVKQLELFLGETGNNKVLTLRTVSAVFRRLKHFNMHVVNINIMLKHMAFAIFAFFHRSQFRTPHGSKEMCNLHIMVYVGLIDHGPQR